MSYTYEPPIVVDENKHHHHHNHHSTSKSSNSEETSAGRMWAYGICCILISGLLIFSFIVIFMAPSYYHDTNQMHTHMEAKINELTTLHTSQIGSKNSISLSNVFNPTLTTNGQGGGGTQSRPLLDLCVLEDLYSENALYNASVKRFTTETINHLYQELNDTGVDANYYYKLSMKMALEFNVDTTRYQNRITLDPKEKYMIVSYDIFSSYPHFSTIKLIEIATDTRSHLLIKTNEIILCSNNPAVLNKRLCSTPTSTDYSNEDRVGGGGGGSSYQDVNQLSNHFFVKEDALIVLMSHGLSGTTVTNDGGGMDNKQQQQQHRQKNQTNQQQSNEAKQFLINKKIELKYNFIKDMRSYYIIFFRQIKPNATQMGQQQSRIPNHYPYHEEQILTIKPDDCL